MNPDELVSPAVVPPWAAYVLLRDRPEAVLYLEEKGRSLVLAGKRTAGEQLVTAAVLLRRAAREQAAAAGRAPEVVSAGGSPEVPQAPGDACSSRPPSSGLTTREVVERFRSAGLEISGRQITNLCRAGEHLSATWTGRQWLADEVSVAEEIKRRRDERE